MGAKTYDTRIFYTIPAIKPVKLMVRNYQLYRFVPACTGLYCLVVLLWITIKHYNV